MISVFGHGVRSEMLLLYVIDALACFSVVYLLLALGAGHGGGVEQGGVAAFAGVLAVSSGPLSGAGGLYRPEAWSQARRMLAGILVVGSLLLPLAVLALMVLGPVLPEGPTWRGLSEVVLAAAATVVLTRLGFGGAWRAGLFTRRIAVLRGSAARAAAELAAGDGGPRSAFEVVLTIRPGEALEEKLAPEGLRALRVWAVVVADGAALPETVRHRCEGHGVRVFGETEFCERYLGRVDFEHLSADWLHTASGARASRVEAVAHRCLDVTAALAVLLLTLPLLLLTALAIKLDSRGPVFYRQDRVGRGGRVFTLLKFRSMGENAEAGGAPCWATKQDPRVTRVGRFIRLARIDEIPQVLNVLRGDMAFVGPRPERPAFVEQLGRVIPHYHDRACVKPGITGWAQVNYPYGASVEDARKKLAYDLYYVRRRSLFLDLLILVDTVRVVLFQEGSR